MGSELGGALGSSFDAGLMAVVDDGLVRGWIMAMMSQLIPREEVDRHCEH
jgi:hypothetical protein